MKDMVKKFYTDKEKQELVENISHNMMTTKGSQAIYLLHNGLNELMWNFFLKKLSKKFIL